MGLIGSLATLRGQAPRTEGFATAFRYLDELLRTGTPANARVRALAAGTTNKVELSGGVYVVEQAYHTKPRAEGFFESHQKYIDVQVLLEGEELMELVDASLIKVREPFNPERDLVLYHDTGDATPLRLFAGHGAIFFPVDVHMPSLQLRGQPVLARKAVVKVPVAG